MAKGRRLTPRAFREDLKVSEQSRRECFRELLKHIEEGYSISCYEKLSSAEVYEYIKLFPEEFDFAQLENSMRRAHRYWEDIGKRQADGTCVGNSRSWYYNMVNRYGWREKVEVEATHKGAIAVNIVNYAPDSDSDS